MLDSVLKLEFDALALFVILPIGIGYAFLEITKKFLPLNSSKASFQVAFGVLLVPLAILLWFLAGL